MLISLEEAKDTLRLERDWDEFDPILVPLIQSIPSYLEVTTGRTWEQNPVHPLAQTTAKLILQLWYDPHSKEVNKLKRTIDHMLAALTVIGRGL